MVIWKYEIRNEGDTVLELPEGAKVIYVDSESYKVTLWVIVNLNNIGERRRFCAVRIGEKIPEGAEYVGSCPVVYPTWHIFERKDQQF